MKKLTYENKLQKLKEATLRKEARLKKRLALTKVKRPGTRKLKKDLWKLVSKYVRTLEPNCYTCGKYLPKFSEREAGHYWTQGGHKPTVFDLMNVHTQCHNCNHWKSGNLAEYAARLIEDYGIDKFQDLKVRAKSNVKVEKADLENLIQEYKSLLLTLNQ